MFDVKWYMLQMHQHDEERSVIQHDKEFLMMKQQYLKKQIIAMFFQANVNKYFTQRFQVRGIGHFLLDMIQEEGQ